VFDVKAPEGEEQRGTSWSNAAEVMAVLDVLTSVLQVNRNSSHLELRGAAAVPPVSAEEVAVITPYLQQKHALQSHIARRAAETGISSLSRVCVSTVDGFQGAERDLIIFSAVRSNAEGRLGFLRDERRANVLLTRARRGLVVLADVATLREARGTVWARWLEWAEAAGVVVPLATLHSATAQAQSPMLAQALST
jgi:hypothetical protein